MISLDTWLNDADDMALDEWLEQGLIFGCDYFSMTTGIVSLITRTRYSIRAVYSSLADVFAPGMTFPLSDTYCSAVAKSNKTVTYIQVGIIPGMVLHPVYTALQLESYIGAPLFDARGNIIGTLNFSSHQARQWEFDDDEIRVIETMARKIASRLVRQG